MRLYKKIYLTVLNNEGLIVCQLATNWSKTCREAKINFIKAYPQYDGMKLYANFAK